MKLFIILSISILAVIFGRINLPTPDSSSFAKETFWVDKVFSSNNNNIIVYGDSRVYRGVSIDDLLGINQQYKGLNLGFNSSGINDDIFEFINKKINRNADYKIIILGVTPNLFTEKAALNSHYNEIKGSTRSEVLLKMYIYTYLETFDRRTPLDLYYSIYEKSNRYRFIETFHKRGWVESVATPIDTNGACANYQLEFSKGKSLKENQQKLLNQISLWKQKGIKVYAFEPPISNSLKQIELQYSGFNYKSFITQFQIKGGIWLDIPKNKWKTYDGSHLKGDDSKSFSNYLGKIILSDLKN